MTLLHYFGPRAGFYAPALAGGVVLFGLYLVPWLLLLRRHNRYTSQPAGLLTVAFVCGGIAAPFWIALPANTALLEIRTKIGGTSFATNWAAGLAAPFNEEWGKDVGLVLILTLPPRLVRSAYDGFIIWVLRHAASQERAWTRDLLEPEVEAGVVDPALLNAVSGLRKDRKRYAETVHSRSRSRHLVEAANDLAHEIALAGGDETGRVAHARAELARVRQTG